jgi:hypothetical protein
MHTVQPPPAPTTVDVTGAWREPLHRPGCDAALMWATVPCRLPSTNWQACHVNLRAGHPQARVNLGIWQANWCRMLPTVYDRVGNAVLRHRGVRRYETGFGT